MLRKYYHKRFPNLNFLRLLIARPTRCLFTSLKLILFINRYTRKPSARRVIHQFHSICPHTRHLLRSKAINDAQQAGAVYQNKLTAFPSASSWSNKSLKRLSLEKLSVGFSTAVMNNQKWRSKAIHLNPIRCGFVCLFTKSIFLKIIFIEQLLWTRLRLIRRRLYLNLFFLWWMHTKLLYRLYYFTDFTLRKGKS